MNNTVTKPPVNAPIAIIGIGCFFPKASGLKAYWRLLFHGIDAISDVPDSHWSVDDYFDADPGTKDKIYCTRGGFLAPVDFDPTEYGIPPNTLEATDTSQLLGLVAAKMALDDAGYGETGKSFNRDRTSVILGVTGTQELVIPLGARLDHPKWRKALKEANIPDDKAEEVVRRISSSYVSWQENSFPGLLGNVVAGRICNRLDLGGTNCVVDAACASSMSAIHLATLELSAHRCDMALTGGVDTLNDIFMHMCFGQTGILSPSGEVRPFSKEADGTLLGEGVGIVALKRLADAERDNDRVYAVIRSVGASSDGRSQSIYAPRKEGQVKALTMAYDLADIDPATIELIEAHGTGTRVGDQTEFQTLNEVFSSKAEKKEGEKHCALGAVKSMIGHTKAAAGTAGLIKTALALHHKALPPTLKADPPDPDLKIEKSPFYLNTTTRPWLSESAHPRRGGVSAFGFGGSNFHVVLEEHRSKKDEIAWNGSVEIIALSADTPEELTDALSDWAVKTDQGYIGDQFAARAAKSRTTFDATRSYRLLLVIDLCDDDDSSIKTVIDDALAALKTSDPIKTNWVSGTTFFGKGAPEGKLAFVFPGQGSQYVNMGRDLMCIFPEALDAMEQFNHHFGSPNRLSDRVYPPPAQSKQDLTHQEAQLRSTDIAQPAIGAVSSGMYRILSNFGLSPDSVCGHSYGELPALLAGGWLNPDGFCRASIARGRLMAEAGKKSNGDPGTMLAVKADLSKLDALVASLDSDVILANRNSPSQGVLSGSTTGIEAAAEKCRQSKLRAIPLPVAAAFHSRLVADAHKPFRQLLDDIDLTPTDTPVFSNTTGKAYSSDPMAARDLLGNQIINPVDFVADIKNQYEDGVRTFVEIGPKTVLTGLIRQILKKQDHAAITMDASGGKKPGLFDLAKCICHLAALGYSVQLDRWENPPPSGERRKPIMQIPVGGANITNPLSGQSDVKSQNQSASAGYLKQSNTSGDKAPLTKDHMDQHTNAKPGNTPPFAKRPSSGQEPSDETMISHTLAVIREGLKSMREIQARTAKAHELFLETQAEAGRVLQSLMQRTGQIAHTTGVADSSALRSAIYDPTQAAISNTAIASQPPSPSEHPQFEKAPYPDGPSNTTVSKSRPDQAKTAPPSASVVDTLYAVIGELTGYPSEMLNLEMNIEADLGIDSIKRVEILSTMEERMPELPSVSPDDMGELKTLSQIVSYLSKDDLSPLSEKSIQSPTASPTMTPISPVPEPHSSDVAATLFEVVSELTGYPVTMLTPEMGIEADLGIDSIKRVEILSTMEERMPELPSVSPDDMGDLKSLGQIIDYLSSGKSAPNQESPMVQADGAPRPAQPDPNGIKRQVITAKIIPTTAASPSKSYQNATIVITEDGSGMAGALASALSKQGISAAVIPTDPNALKQIKDPIGGFIPIFPAAETSDYDTIRQLFLLTQAVGRKWVHAPQTVSPMFAAITRMDGAFGFLGHGLSQPLQGALTGLVKTAAMEWPGVQCHAIDVASKWSDYGAIAEAVLNAVINSDESGPIEIGLHPDLAGDEQYWLIMEDSELPDDPPELSCSDVVVVTGGARGITAQAVIALAHRTGATFALLGRSPQPTAMPEWLENLIDPVDVKKAILVNEFNGAPPSPVELENAYRRHTANREIQKTLYSLTVSGVNAVYYCVDVANAEQVNQTLKRVRSDQGKITVLIHGAGILRDSLIVDKRIEDLDAVFNTKVQGLKYLLGGMQQDALRHLVLFSSVTARFGNSGQSDYAMANEVLNKIAQVEAVDHPDCKVRSINWGPWEGGMVSPALKRMFEDRGVQLIPASVGADFLVKEMGAETSGSVEVVIGSGFSAHENHDALQMPAPQPPADPTEGLNLSFRREVDLHHYPILNSHVLDGIPVVPFALMTEWFGHGALHENPGLVLHGIDDMRLLKGIRMKNGGAKTIRLMAGKAHLRENRFEVPVELRDGVENDVEVIHSRGRAILVETLNQAPTYNPPAELTAVPYLRHVDEVYETILFHGEHLRGLKKINGLTEKGMVAEINSAPSPESWMTEPLRSNWLADPLALDTAFQMASVWCYEQKGMVSLPSYTASYRQYARRFPSEGLKVILEVREVTSRKMMGDFTFIDPDHTVVAQLKGFEAVMDPTLYQSFKPHLTHHAGLNKGRSAA